MNELESIKELARTSREVPSLGLSVALKASMLLEDGELRMLRCLASSGPELESAVAGLEGVVDMCAEDLAQMVRDLLNAELLVRIRGSYGEKVAVSEFGGLVCDVARRADGG